MAKQTFTTGQVLSAAQLTSLQQTAMGGGAATAKTASYVLVAADAGTTVAMNAAGATTITVNTGLFAAGDTVFIQNLGAGACTVTAGTATVATAGSLILPQNDAGILYFTATGASIFYDFIQAAGGGMTSIASGSLSGATVSLTSIAGTYKDLVLVVRDYYFAGAAQFRCQFNTNTGSVYWNAIRENDHTNATVTNSAGLQTSFMRLSGSLSVNNADNNNVAIIQINDYADATSNKLIQTQNAFIDSSTNRLNVTNDAVFNNTTAITSIQIFSDGSTFSGGTYVLYGVS